MFFACAKPGSSCKEFIVKNQGGYYQHQQCGAVNKSFVKYVGHSIERCLAKLQGGCRFFLNNMGQQHAANKKRLCRKAKPSEFL
jgi:hypothetical protein